MKALIAAISIVLLILQYRIWLGDGSYLDRSHLQARITELEKVNSEMRAQNRILTSEVIAIREGGEPLEAIARRELGMIKEGETLVLVIDESS